MGSDGLGSSTVYPLTCTGCTLIKVKIITGIIFHVLCLLYVLRLSMVTVVINFLTLILDRSSSSICKNLNIIFYQLCISTLSLQLQIDLQPMLFHLSIHSSNCYYCYFPFAKVILWTHKGINNSAGWGMEHNIIRHWQYEKGKSLVMGGRKKKFAGNWNHLRCNIEKRNGIYIISFFTQIHIKFQWYRCSKDMYYFH